MFLEDNRGAEALPMRLVVTVILFAVILGLLVSGLKNFVSDAQEKKLQGDLDVIEKRAALMYKLGGTPETGTREEIHISIPDSISYVVFGGMPGKGMGDMRTDNAYYYVVDGRTQTRSSISRFRSSSGGPVILYPGEYDLVLELVKDNNGTYVRMREINEDAEK